jgi:gluconate 5-dehydrogenase
MNESLRAQFELNGKVALVTGGSRGLGLQIAQGLAQMGARIAISARTPSELEAARAQFAQDGVEVLTVVCDLADRTAIDCLVASTVAKWGTIDILVNNAGMSWGAPAEDHSLVEWDKVMTLNASSVFALSQTVAKRCFIPQGSGNIIVIASTAALRASMQMKAAAYYSSKAAVLHLTKVLAVEWGRYGIRVNAICPGFFPSKMSDRLLTKIEASVVARTPLGRIGGATDLQGAALYFASDASRFVTGQYVAVDGGASLG